MFLLAEIAVPSSLEIGGWMGCAFFAVALWNGINKAFDRNREKPAPAETYATKLELARVEKELKEEALRVAADVKSLRLEIIANGETRRASIEGKVEAVRKEVKGDIDGVHRRVDLLGQNFDERLENLPSQIIALLRNTGALKS
jgi:hypothetical protein